MNTNTNCDCADILKIMETVKMLGSAAHDKSEEILKKRTNVHYGIGVDLSSNSVVLRNAVTPKCIKRRGTATIVEWADGTQTKIIRAADEEDMGLYAAFCIALAKKLYGNNSALKKAIHFADEERQLAVEQEIAEMRKRAHEERMRKQLDHSTKRIGRLARRAFKREIIANLATESIQVEEEVEPC